MSAHADHPAPAPPARDSRLARHAGLLMLVAGVPMLALLIASFGLPADTPGWLGGVTLAINLLTAGALALLMFASGAGIAGVLVAFLARNSPHRPWLAAGLSAGAMGLVSHALGALGLLAGPRGAMVGGLTLIAGATPVIGWCVRSSRLSRRVPSVPLSAAGGCVALGVLLVAACSPPGWLWRSEAGGFDALSYHLMLPQEWLARGRLAPLEHNVYSYLPGYAEGVFMHLGAVAGGLGGGPGEPPGLLAHEGLGVIACQLWHALVTIAAGALTGRLAHRLARRAGLAPGASAAGGGVAFACVVTLPWSVVCGSLAYNEMGVVALLATGLLVACDDTLTPARRGALAGLCAALACGLKPTAAFVVAPGIGLMLVCLLPPRAWIGAILAGVLAGTIVMAPPLVRNALHGGNPIFPAGASIFGPAHWNSEQLERFARAHREHAPLADRAAMLVSPEPDASSLDHQPRGLLHRQWSLLPMAGLVALGCLTIPRATRAPALVLLGGVMISCAWWIGFSHAQSRFLLPLCVPMGAAAGLFAAIGSSPGARAGARIAGSVLGCAVPIACTASVLWVFAQEGRGQPNAMLVPGIAPRIGASQRRALDLAQDPAQRRELIEALDPVSYVNLMIPPGEKVYLLGDAAPLYFTAGVLYRTTWDAGALERAIDQHPDDPGAWADALRRLGVVWVLVNDAELARYARSGWLDPRLSERHITRLLEAHGRVVRRWPGSVLIKLRGTDEPGAPRIDQTPRPVRPTQETL